MRTRRSRAVSLLVTSVVLTGVLVPWATAQTPDAEPAPGPGTVAPALVDVADVADVAAEPPAQPARTPAGDLFGADCATRIDGSTVTAHCHNRFARTDRVRLHVECDRWWDLDSDAAPVAVGPAGRAELAGRCWKEVRAAWVSHQRP
ncbi:hypothetical protein [Streptomyces antimicrobicus]|uniref:Secreted protein n=1 Tax=Streptomyces antimicrobicus TaxID=2883108 RepID=A0ABS8B996_9ACTN|nr:hypothetical protein [Streptomyces antimicrobicus]MCB5181195.1 hypothetical protein [Streptomyces antimicrobicus]